MYNRYISSDNGDYRPMPPPPPPEQQEAETGGGFLHGIFSRLGLKDIDTGDILLLLLVFLLYSEGGDEELLLALALAFIL